MGRWLMVAAMAAISPAMAADLQGKPSAGVYDLWSPQQGENDTLHGIWVVNASSGRVYRCVQYAGTATCVEARMMTADEWARMSQQNQPRK